MITARGVGVGVHAQGSGAPTNTGDHEFGMDHELQLPFVKLSLLRCVVTRDLPLVLVPLQAKQ